MKILIVDDEPAVRRMIRLALDREHEVTEVAGGEEALRLIGPGRAPFDLVLLDQKMPGMSGIETLRALQQRAPRTQVVMITAFASLGLAAEAIREGARHFLAKPMTPDLLRAAVSAAWEEAAREQSRQSSGAGSVTVNGFTIHSHGEPVSIDSIGDAVHRFRVTNALAGWTKVVPVRIRRDAMDRAGHPEIGAGGRVANLLARRLLAEHVWKHGVLPDDLKVEEADGRMLEERGIGG